MWNGDMIDSFDEVSIEEKEEEQKLLDESFRWTYPDNGLGCRFGVNCSAIDWMERYGASPDEGICDDCPFCEPLQVLAEYEDKEYGDRK